MGTELGFVETRVKERRKEAMMIQEKSSNGYYSIAAYFIFY